MEATPARYTHTHVHTRAHRTLRRPHTHKHACECTSMTPQTRRSHSSPGGTERSRFYRVSGHLGHLVVQELFCWPQRVTSSPRDREMIRKGLEKSHGHGKAQNVLCTVVKALFRKTPFLMKLGEMNLVSGNTLTMLTSGSLNKKSL